MPYVILGATTELQIKVPTKGTTDWADTLRTDTFLKIAQHDHSGSGKGKALGTTALQADAVTGAKIRLDNDEYLRGRNAANSANIDIVKVNASDKLVFATNIVQAVLETVTAEQITSAGSSTLTDNTASATTASVITLASNESCSIHYRIVRGVAVQSGTIKMDQSNTGLIERFRGDDCGITFTNNAGTLEYTSTSTGSNASLTYTIIKE